MPEFYGHPGAVEAKKIGLYYKKNKNPVLRGIALVVVAWLYVDLLASTDMQLIYY